MKNKVDCSKVNVIFIEGFGDSAIANQNIKKGELVEKGLIRRVETDGHKNQYLFTWSEDRTVWGFGSGCATFYNTSRNPNTKMIRYFNEDRYEIFATRDIAKGEQVTHKYKSLDWRKCFKSLSEMKDL